MLRATLKNMLARKLRLVLSAMSIVLGVSFVAGAFVLTDSLGKVFDQLFDTIGKNVAVDVRGVKVTDSGNGEQAGRQLVPASVLDKVRSVEGVAEVEPTVQGAAQIVGTNGKVVTTGGAPSLGFNWSDSPTLEVGHIAEGRAPKTAQEILINGSLATRSHYKVGDQAPVLTDAPLQKFTIVGIVKYKDEKGSLAGELSIYFETATAQKLLNSPNAFTDISLAAKAGVSQATLRDRVAKALPTGVEAITGKALADENSSEVKKGLGFFNTFLLTFAAIALFVGSFIIFNTFSMLVAQRTRELALMRMMGASRGQVTRSVLLEALVMGFISSVIGLGVGILVALGLKALFGAFGAEFPSGPTIVAGRTIILSFVVGMGVTAVAAFFPARRASKVAPLAALRDAATPDRSLRRQTLAGAVLLLIGMGMMARALTAGGLLLLGIGTLFVFVGVAMLSPLISRPVTGTVGKLFSRRISGRLGRNNSLRNPRRTASTAAALMIGLALISAVSVLGASLKSSVAKITKNAIGAEIILDVQGPGFPDAVLETAAKEPGVRAVSGVKADRAKIGSSQESVVAVNSSAVGDALIVNKVSGVAKLSPTTILLSESAAKAQKVKVGGQLTLTFAHGSPQQLTVAGIFKPNQLSGDYLVDSSLAKDFTSPRNLAAMVSLDKGVDIATVRDALDKRLAEYPNVVVEDQAGFVKTAADQVDQIVLIINILLALSVLIALLGVVNTLALSVIERTRELGLLRAIGMARKQMKRMIRVEAVVICVFGGLLGLVIGTLIGIALQQALSDDGVSELGIPIGTLVVFLFGAALAGVLAAWLPARRASRLNVLQAIATE